MSTAKSAPPPVEDIRWTSPWLLFAVIAATFVALFAVTVLLPHDPYVRYQQLAKTIQFRSQWVYERTALDKTPIDVAIVGNSRLGAGISSPQLRDALGRELGHPVHVANLSMPQEGRNIHFAIVKRLLEDHPEVKLIVLSAIEQMPRGGHPAFRDLADAKDVVAAPKLLNLDYANDIAVIPYRQISLFVQSLAPALFGHRTKLDPKSYGGSDFDTTTTFRLPDGKIVERDQIVDEATLAATAGARTRETRPPMLPKSLSSYEFVIEHHYTDEIARMARAKGVSIVFTYLPIYRNPKPASDVDYYQKIGPVLEPSFVAGDYRLYSDYAHLNVHGTRQVTEWLAKQIADLEKRGQIGPIGGTAK